LFACVGGGPPLPPEDWRKRKKDATLPSPPLPPLTVPGSGLAIREAGRPPGCGGGGKRNIGCCLGDFSPPWGWGGNRTRCCFNSPRRPRARLGVLVPPAPTRGEGRGEGNPGGGGGPPKGVSPPPPPGVGWVLEKTAIPFVVFPLWAPPGCGFVSLWFLVCCLFFVDFVFWFVGCLFPGGKHFPCPPPRGWPPPPLLPPFSPPPPRGVAPGGSPLPPSKSVPPPPPVGVRVVGPCPRKNPPG